MNKAEHKISLQVFVLLIFLYLLFEVLAIGLEPIRKKIQQDIVYAGLGSKTYEQCMESNKEKIQQEFKHSKLESNSEDLEESKNKMCIFGFIIILVRFLLIYLFSRFIVRFIIKKSNT